VSARIVNSERRVEGSGCEATYIEHDLGSLEQRIKRRAEQPVETRREVCNHEPVGREFAAELLEYFRASWRESAVEKHVNRRRPR
jgi:hypothetical protein